MRGVTIRARTIFAWLALTAVIVLRDGGVPWADDSARLSAKGIGLLERGAHREAIRNFDQALRLDPLDATAYAGRGFAYVLMGYAALRLEDLEEAIRLNPDLAIAYVGRGEALRQRRQLD